MGSWGCAAKHTIALEPPTSIARKSCSKRHNVIDQKDLNDGDKVKLYNQVLQRYNHLSDRRDKQPTRVVVVKDDATTERATPEKPAAAPATAAPSAVEADIVDSVLKTMKVKIKKLMDRLKTQLSWTDRGELLNVGTSVPGSNMVDLVNDVLRKRRKSDPVGWQALAQQLKRINLPMELVGTYGRRQRQHRWR